MKIASNTTLGLSMAAGAVIAALGIGAHTVEVDIQAAPATPVHASPEPPSPPPSPSAPPVVQYDPSQDYWTGQGSGGGAPGGAGGGG